MNIQELRKELLLAKKDKNAVKTTVLTMVLSETLNIAKSDGNREPVDNDVLTALKRTLKKSEQSLEYKVPGADDEVNLLKSFLPESMSDEQIQTLVAELKNQHGVNKGLIMKALKEIPGMDMGKASKMI